MMSWRPTAPDGLITTDTMTHHLQLLVLLIPTAAPQPSFSFTTSPNIQWGHASPAPAPTSTPSLDNSGASTRSPSATGPGIDTPSSTASAPSQAPPTQISVAHTCDICHELAAGVDELIAHLTSRHPETTSDHTKPFFCGRSGCKRIRSRREFIRHLTKTDAHSRAHWRCCCGRHFSRKENFQQHFVKRACKSTPTFKYVCSCTYEDDDIRTFRAHFEPCGRGRRGRPKKA
ncbi:hypothetical protein GGR56DRAFT_484365 [Xylariaceae sp. FL0804]|nr:hypothetical protein GGR56DRAFT_484365 [Xylariaceae sp. FL0804]